MFGSLKISITFEARLTRKIWEKKQKQNKLRNRELFFDNTRSLDTNIYWDSIYVKHRSLRIHEQQIM